MDALKDSNKSQLFLIVGLFILVISVLFALDAILRLDEAIESRRTAYDVQNGFGDLSNDVKDWVLLSEMDDETPAVIHQKQELEDKIENGFSHLQAKIAADTSQLALLFKSQLAWTLIKEKPSDLERRDLDKFALLVRQMDDLETSKVNFHEPKIVKYTYRLIFYVGFAVFAAIVMIIFALYSKNKQDILRLKTIEDLALLKEQAVSASNLKSKFLSTVSHEIRTPLNGIIGLSDILVHRESTEADKKFIKTIHQSGKTLLGIINDILDFSKIESGKFELENNEFSVVEVIEQVVFTVSAKASEKSIGLSYELDPNLAVSYKGDSGRLSQVLFNLLGNAIKFTQIGSVILRAKSFDRSPEESGVYFSVEDTGEGISREEMKNLFVPFVQGRKVGTSGEPGTGLGLSICHHIVTAMGGKIQVESRLGHGSNFWFEIPLRKVRQETIGQNSNFRSKKSVDLKEVVNPLFVDFKPKILVVEDNPTNQIVAQTMLSQLGAESIVASDGNEAIDMVQKMKFDLILMDCQMPHRDGFEATTQIRKMNIFTPIIAMTANVAKEDEEKCRSAGMNGFLAKPLLLEEIKKIIEPFTQSGGNSKLKDLEKKIGRESTQKVVRSFLLSLEEFSTKLEEFKTNQQLAFIQKLGHRFKSAALTVGADNFYKACVDFENCKDLEMANSALHQFSFSFKEAQNIAQEYLKVGP